MVDSHAFICSTPEKPSVTSGRFAGSCTRAYTPSDTATATPHSKGTARPADETRRAAGVGADIHGPPPEPGAEHCAPPSRRPQDDWRKQPADTHLRGANAWLHGLLGSCRQAPAVRRRLSTGPPSIRRAPR